MTIMTFSLDEYRLPIYQAEDGKYQALGAWITTDISIYKKTCLDALAMVHDIVAGRAPFEPWSSENYEVDFSPSGVRIQNLWVPHEKGEYSVADMKEVVEEYWKFLASIPDNPQLVRGYRPDLPEWQADLLRWEETWNRPHPYRGTFF
ncbi:hypothetical protein [Actinomadura opuntiae]|uniref:hypothetical protein n=1 Tax=Actinomadura sp. OS1-43 TaxID=604315 RepID=UPI00255B163F|nr:hypothetical protein [Actinomadura sp. OS1-43]MDL4816854.1 hypothetical protein [Actinomadura sp. OS1-43]